MKKLPGKPDIVLKKYKTVILINGCLWHMHEKCKYFVIPKTRTEWWLEKLSKNIKRDEDNKKKLKQLGWKVIEIWECSLKKDKIEQTLMNLLEELNCLK